ncbi:MAG: radical SAM protein [Chitinispirillaceae bacterium]|nr:radical SAM protein [Chitinispirillaceae bacterium]
MVTSTKSSYIFGPVPSRRLGHSLGIDLVPFKTCSYDCIYCQLGTTTNKTIEQKEYVPQEEVIAQLSDKLQTLPPVDYITLSGSGEPTLYSRTASLIDRIKEMTNIPVAVLTNGSLLFKKSVRKAISRADLVIPSLDAGSDPIFQFVNRPYPGMTFDTMVAGIRDFRQEYTGILWLEVFLLDGITATRAGVEEIARQVSAVLPNKVQLNTVTRPPSENSARAVSQARMQHFAEMFEGKAEVIADYRNTHNESRFVASREEVLQLVRRRPCTLDDVSAGLSIHRNEALKYLEHLVHDDEVRIVVREDRCFYVPC